MLDFGILWNNARNLLYIRKFNDKKAIRLANNKLETKRFLWERWIPFAKTYAVIKNRKELAKFNFLNLQKKEFVIKPNHWSKGKWIYICKTLEEKPEIKKRTWLQTLFKKSFWEDNYYISTWKKAVGETEFKRYLTDIISGKHSMTTWDDRIIVEEILRPWEAFKDFCEFGLADIRVIVFNLVPVAAMIRIPTDKSGGKANLAAGWIWLGIEVWTGKITSMLFKWKIYTKKFPEKFKHFQYKEIPFRNDILFLSSKIQYFVNLWYLALDRVITNDWPKLLEINARAWLEVQKITWTKLKKTLEKLDDMKVTDPEKWVEICKSLFSQTINNNTKEKVLFLSQYWNIEILNENKETESIHISVKADTSRKLNYISIPLYERLKNNIKKITLNLTENQIILKWLKFKPLENLAEDEIILWTNTSKDYLIKPIHKTFETIDIIDPNKILLTEKNILHTIDANIEILSKKLILSKILRPTNYFNELDIFISKHGKYNPQFEYKFPSNERIELVQKNLEKNKQLIEKNKLKSPITKLFLEKIDELENRVLLIKAYKEQDFDNIEKYNYAIFGQFNDELLEIAQEKIFWAEPQDKTLLGEKLSAEQTKEIIEKYLYEKKIFWVDVFLNSNNLSRLSVTMWKETKIIISKAARFRENEVKALLAHEIDCHLVRHINWMKSWRNILKSGTWYYLSDEEGFAVYSSDKRLPDNYEKLSMYKKYFIIREAQKYNFSKIIDLINFMDHNRSLEWCFKTAIKIKKWIKDTSIVHPWAIAMKEKVYLDWYYKVKKWIEDWWDEEKMYKGKLKIEDLDYIK